MPLLSIHTRHRLEFAAAILGTVGAVYGFSQIIKPKPSKIAAPVTYVSTTSVQPKLEQPILRPDPIPPPTVPPAFAAAVNEGDIAAMDRLYTPGMALDGMLYAACANAQKDAVAWLIEHKADVHESELDANAPILVVDEHPEIAKLLLAAGAEEPPLSVAATQGAVNSVLRSLAKKVDVNEGSPLFNALGSSAKPEQKIVITEKLLAAGAKASGVEGEGVPMVAAINDCGSGDEEDAPTTKPPMCIRLIKMLSAKGATINGDALQSALNQAENIRGAVLDAVLSGKIEPGATASALSNGLVTMEPALVKKVVAHGVDWAFHDGEADAVAPLVDAVDRMDLSAVKVLLDAGAPADRHFKDGRCALGIALEKVSMDPDAARIIEVLIARGANVNRRLPDGRTPLFAAAESGDIRVINALLDHGARVNEVILDVTALDAAESSGHMPAARVLHSRGGRRAQSMGVKPSTIPDAEAQ